MSLRPPQSQRKFHAPSHQYTWAQKFKIHTPNGVSQGHFHVVEVDGRPKSIHVTVNREGTFGRAMMTAWAEAINLCLAHDVPLATIVDTFKDYKFEPNGPVESSAAVTRASSLVDLVMQELTVLYLQK